MSFWKDNWLSESNLLQCATWIVEEEAQQGAVRDYWEVNRGWMWVKFSDAMPNMTLMKLATLRLHDTPGVSDEVSWAGGGFTVKSAYKLATRKSEMPVWEGWKRI